MSLNLQGNTSRRFTSDAEVPHLNFSSVADCFALCDGTAAQNRLGLSFDGQLATSGCTGVEYDPKLAECFVYDVGVAVPDDVIVPDDVAVPDGKKCYKRVYPQGAVGVCEDIDERCAGWAAKVPSECSNNPTWMEQFCAKSCGHCISKFTGQTSLVFLTIDGYGDNPTLKGWNLLQLGESSPHEDFDRCQDVEQGSVKNLPVRFPYPPSSPPWNGVTDRFRVSCIRQERVCTAAHRASHEFCVSESGSFAIVVDYFMDCENGFVGCKEGSSDDRANKVKGRSYCFRGRDSAQKQDRPAPFGYRWPARLCKQDKACTLMGNKVYAQNRSAADTLVHERAFLSKCCTITDLNDVPCPVGGDKGDCMLYKMCAQASFATGVSPAFRGLLVALGIVFFT